LLKKASMSVFQEGMPLETKLSPARTCCWKTFQLELIARSADGSVVRLACRADIPLLLSTPGSSPACCFDRYLWDIRSYG
jgi:hypothetical protein